jgi:hypothetical protein
VSGISNSAPWYGAPDAETLGYIQAHGLDKMPPNEAAMKMIESYRAAEKMLGIPKDQLLRIPAVGDTEGWNQVHARLGMPEKPEGYDFSAFKNLDGSAFSDAQVGTLREMAHELRLDPPRAMVLVQKLMAIAKAESDTAAATASGDIAKEVAALKTNWGVNMAANSIVAKNAAAAFGVDPSILDTNGGPVVIPYSKAMELFRGVGAKTGEDKFVTGTTASGSGVMTKEQAAYRLSQLQNDKAWSQRFFNGDVTAVKEFYDLTGLVAANA